MLEELAILKHIQYLEARLRSLERVELPVAGSGGFAPSDAQYLTLAASGGLTNERIFTPVSPLSGADGGAGLPYSLSIVGSALSKVDDTNVTLTLGGTPLTALLAAVSLTLGWTGQLSIARGGTGAATLAAAGIVTGALTNGQVMRATGATTIAGGAGFLTDGSYVAIGSAAAINTTIPLDISNTATDPAANQQGFRAIETIAITSNSALVHRSSTFRLLCQIDGNNLTANAQIGSVCSVTLRSTGGGTLSHGFAVQAERAHSATNQGTTWTNAVGLQIPAISNTTGNTITNDVYMFIVSTNNGGTTNVKILINPANTYPTGNWAIYNASTDDNHIAGDVGLGTVTAPACLLHIGEATLGDEVTRITSTATNDDPQVSTYQNRVATTDATATTLHTIAIASGFSYLITAHVIARRTGGSAGTANDSAAYIVAATVKDVSGTATLVGAVGALFTAEDQAAWDCTIDVTGANARVRVTGATNNNVTWHLSKLEVMPLSS